MATSIGAEGGGRVDVRRLLTNPWLLGALALAVLVAVVMWRRTGSSQTPAASVASASQPATTQAAQAADQFGLATSGLQQELSNLVAQWSAGIASLQTPTSGQPPGNVTPQGNSVADIYWHQVLGQTSPTPTQDLNALELGSVSYQVQHGTITPQQATSGWWPQKAA